jgi:hypothetical protein
MPYEPGTFDDDVLIVQGYALGRPMRASPSPQAAHSRRSSMIRWNAQLDGKIEG